MLQSNHPSRPIVSTSGFLQHWPCRLAAALILCVLLALPGKAATKWDPVLPADLAETECKAAPGAHAEILFEKQVLDSSYSNSWMENYKRIKIYSPKGAEALGILAIEHAKNEKVWNLAARLIQQDGTIVEFGSKDFTEVASVKQGSFTMSRHSLVIPMLKAGDIIELQWDQDTHQYNNYYIWSFCQALVPTRDFRFQVRTSQRDYNVYAYSPGKAAMNKLNDYSSELVIRDIPAFEEEPNMPPLRDVRGWFMVLYTHPYMRWFKGDSFWRELSEYVADEFKVDSKPGTKIREQTRALIAGAQTPEEKLRRLYEFCQDNISNLTYFDSETIQAAKKKLADSESRQYPEDTLKLKTGYPIHITELFASMARAAGFEVRRGLSSSRSQTLNIKHPQGYVFMNDNFAMVKIGDKWKPYAPGDYYLPCGLIHPLNEMATTLICGNGEPVFVTNDPTPAAMSPVTRKATLTLDADGNLEGDIELAYGGHVGADHHQRWQSEQDNEIETELRDGITKRLPSAEVTGFAYQNLHGRQLPLVIKHHIRIPGYAEATGTKLIFCPNIFEHGAAPLFTAANRHSGIFFKYAWNEHDEIEIVLPEDYSLDAPSSPPNVGILAGVIGSSYKLSYKPKSRTLVYKRDFALGGNGVIALQAESYAPIKDLMEKVHASDEHNLVIKPTPPKAPIATVDAQATAK